MGGWAQAFLGAEIMPNKSNLTFRKGCSRAKRNVEPKLGVLLLIPNISEVLV